jgi:hypothetical protein
VRPGAPYGEPDGHCASPRCDNLAAWVQVDGQWVPCYCGPCALFKMIACVADANSTRKEIK